MSGKQAILEAVREMPEELTKREIVEQLVLLVANPDGEEDSSGDLEDQPEEMENIMAALRRAEAEADAGRLIPHAEVEKRVASWILK